MGDRWAGALRGISVAALTLLLAAPVEAGAARTRPGRAGGGSFSPGGSPSGGRTAHGHAAPRTRHAVHHHGWAHYPGYGWSYPGYGWGYYPGYWWNWSFYFGRAYPSRPYVIPIGVDGSVRLPGRVETDVRPKKAEVRIDGVVVGQARDYNGNWDYLHLVAGSHTIAFSKPGFMTLELPLTVEAGGYYRFDDRLQKGSGIDPRSVQAPPAPVEESAADSSAPAYRVDPASSAPSADAALTVGFLHLDVVPGDAAVYLDGAFLARADELSRLHGALPVAPGRHTLDVVRPGYVSQRIAVVVESERPSKVALELERE